MKLDFNPDRGAYILYLPRDEGDPLVYMEEYGLDFSTPASTERMACLFTSEPYAAASFWKYATPAAREQLGYIVDRLEASWAPRCDGHFEVPPDQELWEFQKASIDYALNRTQHALVADEPGLGKTPIAIGIANELRAQRTLVVCPASIRRQWCRRIMQWSTMGTHKGYRRRTGMNDRVYPIESSRYGVDENAPWAVVSWDLVGNKGLNAALAKSEYDLLILDEAHYAKNKSTKRTHAIFGGERVQTVEPLADRARKIVALTGTPLPNRPREAYVMASNLCWESIDFLGEKAFNERFNPRQVNETSTGKVWVDERHGRAAELQNRLRANFMVRHLKREVMDQLKMPVFDLVRVEETQAVKAALELERLLDIDPDNLEGADAEILGHIAVARREMGVAMAPQVADYLAMLIEGGEEKLVVFAWHIEVLDILVRELQRYGVVRVDGRDSAKSKDAKVQAFINAPSIHADPKEGISLILGNVLSLGTGTDGLQHVSNHVLLAEADWVMGNNQQCIDRLDRGGQQNQVQADIFVAPGSIAEKVLASALRKAAITHKALDRRVA